MNEVNQAPVRLLRRKEVEHRTGLGRTTIYNLIRAGHFPAPVTILDRSVAWVESEVEGWIEARIAARPNVTRIYEESGFLVGKR